jgi:serine/threonine protein kinase
MAEVVDQDLNNQLTRDTATDEIGGRSTLVALGSAGEGLRGVSLQELEDETPIEVHAGAEKYEVLKAVGEGGMGKVYAAIDRDLKRPVAIKMLRSSGDRRMEQRFLEEAQIMGRIGISMWGGGW